MSSDVSRLIADSQEKSGVISEAPAGRIVQSSTFNPTIVGPGIGRTRTCNLRLSEPALFPIELQKANFTTDQVLTNSRAP